jgi:hypothetical protein
MEATERMVWTSMHFQQSVPFLFPHILSGNKSLYSILSGYLRTLDRNRLTTDIQHMLTNDANLRASAARYYLSNNGSGGGGRAVASRQSANPAREENGGFMSDFSDSEDDFD